MLTDLREWTADRLECAITLGVAQVIGVFFLVVAFGMSWVALGEWWFGSYEQNLLTLLRHEWLPWIPDVWESGSTGNWLVIWFGLVVVLALIGAVFGMTATWEATHDEHYSFVIMFKAGCLAHYFVSGVASMAVGMIKDTAAGAVSFGAAAWSFLKPGATIYATPFFLLVNVMMGTMVTAICGLVVFSWCFGIMPAFYRGLVAEGVPMGTYPILGIVCITPLVLPAIVGIVLAVRNSFWMGYGFMVWALSFIPTRWKARRAYRLSIFDLTRYINAAENDAFPVDDNFQPICSEPQAWSSPVPPKVSLSNCE